MNDVGRRGRRRIVVDGMHLPEPSDARVLVWEGERIVWVGADPHQAPPVEHTIALPGAWITPGFVDAHVHGTATGLTLDGLDLSSSTSADDVVDRVRVFAAYRDDDPMLGSGWEEHGWPMAVPPSAEQLASAAPGRRIQLDRVDGHSCLVDPLTLAQVVDADGGIDRDEQGRPTGWLREAAAGRARARIRELLPEARLSRARQAAADHAAGRGITAMHEMGTPALSSVDDAVAWSTGDWPVEVIVWWADIDPSVALTHRLHPGGDLFLDGAIGSRTAAVTAGYRDGPDLGELFFSDSEVVDFFVRCTRAGIGGGVHAIGDAAIEQAIMAVEGAAEEVDLMAVRACRHRIEHVELPRPGHARRMAAMGIVASVQPAFDAVWGGPSGLYASRFGRDAAVASNPFSDFAADGCSLAFGSDSTVTPMAPWAGVLAAIGHRGGYSIGRRAALAAATLGGRHVARQEDVGPLRPGYRADLAVWDDNPMVGTLEPPPRCLMTMVAGVITKSSRDDS
jgi:hypothetical protein